MKPGIKQDTWLHLRNAPMFGYGLFPDAVIATAKQDIIKHEAPGTALYLVRVLHSSPGGEQPTDIDLMTEGITGLLGWNRSSSPGDNLVDLGIGGMDGVEVLILVSLVQRDSKLTNDNLLHSSSSSELSKCVEEIKVDKTNCTTISSGQFQCSDSSQGSKFRQCSKTVKTSCILSCCNSCSFCNFKRASAKERYKT